MKERKNELLIKSKGKRVVIYLRNGFRFSGIVSNCDEKWLELIDTKVGLKLISVEDISNVDFYGGETE